ncbi:MAG: 16S rRNA (cytidine(1402)-2'-O)-methyltransferase, partial [Deltaproteobacteria bacterium]|nr:16S rRNA (cytidine(1402)-2'-O)-methyltransferase [Deltaproteobacteria bacterium]
NEKEKAEELLTLLESGKNIAIVSDAGTPGVSDPGYRLVKLASEEGIEVIPVPGPSAAIAALSVSGLSTSSFAFFGFLPRSDKKRKEFLEEIQEHTQTLIFYESPHRVSKTLLSILETLGDRQVSVSRELTKMFEETVRERISRVIEILGERKEIKGEFTIVVEGNSGKTEETPSETLENQLRICRERGSSLKDSVKEVSQKYKVSKRKVYKEALKIWEKA